MGRVRYGKPANGSLKRSANTPTWCMATALRAKTNALALNWCIDSVDSRLRALSLLNQPLQGFLSAFETRKFAREKLIRFSRNSSGKLSAPTHAVFLRYGLLKTAASFMARSASWSNAAFVESASIRTEPRVCAVTTSGTARTVFSTSAAEQFDRSTRSLRDVLGSGQPSQRFRPDFIVSRHSGRTSHTMVPNSRASSLSRSYLWKYSSTMSPLISGSLVGLPSILLCCSRSLDISALISLIRSEDTPHHAASDGTNLCNFDHL